MKTTVPVSCIPNSSYRSVYEAASELGKSQDSRSGWVFFKDAFLVVIVRYEALLLACSYLLFWFYYLTHLFMNAFSFDRERFKKKERADLKNDPPIQT